MDRRQQRGPFDAVLEFLWRAEEQRVVVVKILESMHGTKKSAGQMEVTA